MQRENHVTHRTAHAGPACRGLTSEAGHDEFALLDTVPVGIVVLKADASVLYANKAAHLLFQTDGETLSLADVLCPTDAREIQDHLRSGNQFEALVAGQHHHRHVTVSVAEASTEHGRDYVLSVTDITPLKRATERAEFLAHHDPLTRLGNRALLQSVWDVLEERLASGRVEIHAMALDLDHFKEVNDAHGHAVGDIVLRQAATRLREVVGEAGHVFRFGGDEFFVLIDDVPRSLAVELGQMIVADLSRPMTVLGHEITIGCSIGIASAPLDGVLRDPLHRAADLALYDVKRNGRGNVACFDPMQEQELLNRRLLQADLVLALANDALDIAFRPQVDTLTCETKAYEVAVAWTNRRTGGQLDGADLAFLAEDTGLRHILDLWTVRVAIERFADIAAEAARPPLLCVELGASTLLRHDIADILVDALGQRGLAPERLEVQIAETAMADGGGDLERAVERLQGFGIHLVVGGFCVRRQTLRYLRSLGVKRVKVDRRTAQDLIGDDEEDANALVEALAVLCRRLEIELSVDGIETARQWDSLRKLGSIRAQGPFLEPPGMPAGAAGKAAAEQATA
ncbi:bifunctional diguanylate cyclase/phosphodiesterase [Aureimonas sp. SK2]|uniref:putative bifunctional diguanylate cyclase/phosphodiesterase n=1 Tax=Aureimonas sp. SK2 TaxID=3015992 RepID=UPI002444D729|nr:EAL domain-containing protein [Aureimonas sp. SK2]